MSNSETQSNNRHSFKQFLLNERRNRIIIYMVTAALVCQFSIFKYLYPFANYIHGDSFSYLNAADFNLTLNTYLIGYSKFLRLVSIFAKPDIVLVSLQFLLIQSSALFLTFTIFYFYRIGRNTQIILLCFMAINPLFLHLANMVSSDGLFLALSMTWFTLLLWIIHQPSNKILICHALVLFIAFIVRYNAMIYPIISIIAFWLSKMPLRKKVLGLGLALALCGWFVGLTMFQYKKLTGYWQYSPFSGWQFANNAMYAYRYVDSADRKPVSKEYQELDNMIREFFDTTRNTLKHPTEAIMASTFYMWSAGMPLVKYRNKKFNTDTITRELKKWAAMGPFFKNYGIYIIRKYPWHFAKYFIWPNANKYYAPPVEFLEIYNSGKDDVTGQTQQWFGYKSKKINTRMKDNAVWILNYYPILSGIMNIVMICCLACYIILKNWHNLSLFRYAVYMGTAVWLLNAIFTIGASSAALRFQSFPIILTSTYVLILIDWLVQLMSTMKKEAKLKPEQEMSNKTVENPSTGIA